jgi:hypothetical protein
VCPCAAPALNVLGHASVCPHHVYLPACVECHKCNTIEYALRLAKKGFKPLTKHLPS